MIYLTLPNDNLKYDDIRDTLNANGGIVSNSVITAFNADAGINPWSKHKPVNFKEPFPDLNSNWWKGDNMRCGMNIGVKQSDGRITSLIKLDDVKNANWFYDPVTKANPKRLGDFRGYSPDAEPALSTGIDKDIVKVNSSDGFYSIQIGTNIGSDPNYLTVDDLNFTLDGYYVAAAIKGKGTFGKWREFRGGLVLGSKNNVDIKTSNLDDGEYETVVFLSDSAVPEEGRYMPLPANALNKTYFTLNLGFSFPYRITLTHIAKARITAAYHDINNYDVETKPFKVGNGLVYFKGYVERIHNGDTSVAESELQGFSENFDLGNITTGLFGCIFNERQELVNALPTPGPNIGDTVPIYIKWKGYTGETEPEEPSVISGALDILYSVAPEKFYYIGGSDHFWITI